MIHLIFGGFALYLLWLLFTSLAGLPLGALICYFGIAILCVVMNLVATWRQGKRTKQ